LPVVAGTESSVSHRTVHERGTVSKPYTVDNTYAFLIALLWDAIIKDIPATGDEVRQLRDLIDSIPIGEQ
jgi:hypothetical protein